MRKHKIITVKLRILSFLCWLINIVTTLTTLSVILYFRKSLSDLAFKCNLLVIKLYLDFDKSVGLRLYYLNCTHKTTQGRVA